jgi:aminomethyltransferase
MTDSGSLRRTPLHPAHVRSGGRLVPFAGWEMPVQYQGVIDEHRAVRTAAGLFDVSHMGEARVTGSGAEAFLQELTPNDVSKLLPGRAHYSALLDENGCYIDDLIIYRRAADEFLVVVNASNASSDLQWMRDHAPAGVGVTDVSDDFALLALQGPRAQAILGRLTTLDLDAIKYYRFADGAVIDRPATVARTGYTGEDGFEIFIAPEFAEALWDRLLETGAEDGLAPAGLGARDTLRLEAGMALYGHEIDATTTPWDAGLDWTVKIDKGGFIGRGALLEQRASGGPSRSLVGFEILGRGIAREGSIVFSGDQAVGRVTSGTWSPTFEKALGMAYVPVELAAPGTPLEIEVRGKRLAAATHPLPFYKRSKAS